MRPITLFLIIAVSFMMGAVLGATISDLLANRSQTSKVQVLVAREPIMQWTTIREPRDLFDIVSIAAGVAPHEFIPAKHIDEMKGRRLKAALALGDCLTKDHLLKKEIMELEPAPGKRAMAVDITADKAVSLFVVPGSTVDVVHTAGGVSNVLLQDIVVLDIHVDVRRPEDGRVGCGHSYAMLQLDSDDQITKLAAAREQGTLSLIIRPLDGK